MLVVGRTRHRVVIIILRHGHICGGHIGCVGHGRCQSRTPSRLRRVWIRQVARLRLERGRHIAALTGTRSKLVVRGEAHLVAIGAAMRIKSAPSTAALWAETTPVEAAWVVALCGMAGLASKMGARMRRHGVGVCWD